MLPTPATERCSANRWSSAGAFCLAAALGAWLTQAAGAADDALWETRGQKLRIAGGRVVSLFDKSRQAELIVEQPTRPLFRVALNRGLVKAHEVESSQMRLAESVVAGGTQRLTYESEQARAVVRFQAGADGGSLQGHIEVEPRERDLAVAQVSFPVLQMRAPLGGSAAADRIVVPFREGHLIHDPLRGGTVKQALRKSFPYPADLVAQFLGYFSDRAGCLLWTDDAEGHVKWFGFERAANDTGLAFFAEHRMPFAAGQRWRMPYQVRVSSFAGSWQAGADIYRAWAARQFWCRTLLKDRSDISPLLRQPCLVISSNLREEDPEELPRLLEEYGRRLGTRVLYRPVGWEKHGRHFPGAGLDYFPPLLGDAGFARLVSGLRERQIAVSGFLTGQWWTTQHDAAPPEVNAALQEFYAKQGGEAVAERRQDGTVWSVVRDGGAHKIRVCTGTPFGRAHVVQEARRLLDHYGVTQIHWDHDHGPEPSGYTCYNTAHGHPVPCGSWASQSLFDSLTAIKRDGLARHPDFFLTKESDTERMNLVLSAYQARYFHRLAPYQGGHPMEIVPVTQFLYHHHLPCIFGFTTFDPLAVARSIVYGQIPSVAFWTGRVAPLATVNQDGVALLADYYAAVKAYARPYLLYGEMTAETGVEIPITRREIRQPGTSLRMVLDDPVACVSGWRDGAGGLGVFAVNPTKGPLSLRCVAPDSASGPLTLVRYVGGEAAQATGSVTPGQSFEWTLPPRRLCGLVYRAAKRASAPPPDAGSAERIPTP
jgi:hypothetical protein